MAKLECPMFKRLAVVFVLGCAFVPTAVLHLPEAAAASTKKTKKKYPDLTSEQRAKLMDYARKICKKSYGASSTVHHVDWSTRKVWCNEH
jgi:hypothetical protein